MDRLFLPVSAVLLAGAAWFFWHFSGESGTATLLTIALIAVGADNIRLRKLLKRRDRGETNPATDR